MRTKSMARDVARLVHGRSADVRCRRQYRPTGGTPAFEREYRAEVFVGRGPRRRGPGWRNRLVLEHAEGRSPAAAYDRLCRALEGRAYVQPIELAADHGEAGAVFVEKGRRLERERAELPADATVLDAALGLIAGDDGGRR